MIGGLKQTTSRFAIAAATGLFMGGIALTPVQAADLGGDCCADLEERVAELEATTVRKSNRKVSVTLYGQVNRYISHWDDGTDENLYFVDNSMSNSRFGFKGTAKISANRTAGFHLEWDIVTSNAGAILSNCNGTATGGIGAVGAHCLHLANFQGDNTGSDGTDTRKQELWVKDRLGKISLGRGDSAGNGASEVSLGGGGNVVASNAADSWGGYLFRNSGTGVYSTRNIGTWTNLDGSSRNDRIRYDTPSLAGFTFSTSVAADDTVDAAIRFKKEWNSVACAAAAQWTHDTNEQAELVGAVVTHNDTEFWSGSASCIHTPSGLNFHVSGGDQDQILITEQDRDFWFVKGGIYRRWNSHGKTSISVGHGETTIDNSSTAAGVSNNNARTVTFTGVEIAQSIDSANMTLYAAWTEWELDDLTGVAKDNITFATFGAKIGF